MELYQYKVLFFLFFFVASAFVSLIVYAVAKGYIRFEWYDPEDNRMNSDNEMRPDSASYGVADADIILNDPTQDEVRSRLERIDSVPVRLHTGDKVRVRAGSGKDVHVYFEGEIQPVSWKNRHSHAFKRRNKTA